MTTTNTALKSSHEEALLLLATSQASFGFEMSTELRKDLINTLLLIVEAQAQRALEEQEHEAGLRAAARIQQLGRKRASHINKELSDNRWEDGDWETSQGVFSLNILMQSITQRYTSETFAARIQRARDELTPHMLELCKAARHAGDSVFFNDCIKLATCRLRNAELELHEKQIDCESMRGTLARDGERLDKIRKEMAEHACEAGREEEPALPATCAKKTAVGAK